MTAISKFTQTIEMKNKENQTINMKSSYKQRLVKTDKQKSNSKKFQKFNKFYNERKMSATEIYRKINEHQLKSTSNALVMQFTTEDVLSLLEKINFDPEIEKIVEKSYHQSEARISKRSINEQLKVKDKYQQKFGLVFKQIPKHIIRQHLYQAILCVPQAYQKDISFPGKCQMRSFMYPQCPKGSETRNAFPIFVDINDVKAILTIAEHRGHLALTTPKGETIFIKVEPVRNSIGEIEAPFSIKDSIGELDYSVMDGASVNGKVNPTGLNVLSMPFIPQQYSPSQTQNNITSNGKWANLVQTIQQPNNTSPAAIFNQPVELVTASINPGTPTKSHIGAESITSHQVTPQSSPFLDFKNPYAVAPSVTNQPVTNNFGQIQQNNFDNFTGIKPEQLKILEAFNKLQVTESHNTSQFNRVSNNASPLSSIHSQPIDYQNLQNQLKQNQIDSIENQLANLMANNSSTPPINAITPPLNFQNYGSTADSLNAFNSNNPIGIQADPSILLTATSQPVGSMTGNNQYPVQNLSPTTWSNQSLVNNLLETASQQSFHSESEISHMNLVNNNILNYLNQPQQMMTFDQNTKQNNLMSQFANVQMSSDPFKNLSNNTGINLKYAKSKSSADLNLASGSEVELEGISLEPAVRIRRASEIQLGDCAKSFDINDKDYNSKTIENNDLKLQNIAKLSNQKIDLNTKNPNAKINVNKFNNLQKLDKFGFKIGSNSSLSGPMDDELD